ncbi:MAG: hypothetical protein M1821_007537 [Bathelium mastoideum]|nr:MAG: hypothetical protein M1821_007537 [Bathelium mastoideum]KAI9695040.1 MAG: hypothetical protein M1822_000657 [Bathelium mastoideum]
MASVLYLFAATAALLRPARAQASTCNPTVDTCNPDPALGKAIFYDFTKGSSNDWTPSTGAAPIFNASGAVFTIAKPLDSPTLFSNWYMMYGHYDIVTQIAPGQGVVSSSVLMSDDKDEIDLEWVGSQTNSLQCNYFGKAQEGSEQTVTVSSPDTTYHTYSIDWTASALTWAVDGKVLRTIASSAVNYPQTPMKLQIGTWPGGDPHEPSGTVNWAGGPINYNDAPFTMIVKSVTAYDYSTGTNYTYSGSSGKESSISSTGGKIAQYSNINGLTVTTASMLTASSSSTSSVASSSTLVSSSASSSTAAGATSVSLSSAAGSTAASSLASSAQSSSAASTTPVSVSNPASVPSSSSAPAQAPFPSTFTTLPQGASPSSGGNSATAVSSAVPVSSSPASPPTGSGAGNGNGGGRGSGSSGGSGHGSGSGSGSGSRPGSGAGTGTSGIPPPIQSGITSIGQENPWLGSILEGFWQWITEKSNKESGRW